MSIKDLVRREYAEAVQYSLFGSAELKASLKTSQRVPWFVDNLATEIEKAIRLNARRGITVKKENVVLLIHDMVDQWLSQLEEHARQRALSPLSRKAEETALDERWNPEKNIRSMGIMTDDEGLQKKDPSS